MKPAQIKFCAGFTVPVNCICPHSLVPGVSGFEYIEPPLLQKTINEFVFTEDNPWVCRLHRGGVALQVVG